MELTLDDRPHYVIPTFRHVGEVDAALAEMESLMAEPVFRQRLRKCPQAVDAIGVAAAALRWVRGRPAETELAGDWHAFLDTCAFNGAQER